MSRHSNAAKAAARAGVLPEHLPELPYPARPGEGEDFRQWHAWAVDMRGLMEAHGFGLVRMPDGRLDIHWRREPNRDLLEYAFQVLGEARPYIELLLERRAEQARAAASEPRRTRRPKTG